MKKLPLAFASLFVMTLGVRAADFTNCAADAKPGLTTGSGLSTVTEASSGGHQRRVARRHNEAPAAAFRVAQMRPRATDQHSHDFGGGLRDITAEFRAGTAISASRVPRHDVVGSGERRAIGLYGARASTTGDAGGYGASLGGGSCSRSPGSFAGAGGSFVTAGDINQTAFAGVASPNRDYKGDESATPPSGVPDITLSGVPDAPSSGVPDITLSGVPDAPSSGVPDITLSGVPDAPSSGVPDIALFGVPAAPSFGVPDITLSGVPGVPSSGVPDITLSGVPEPASALVLGAGMVSLCLVRRKRD